MALGSYKIDLDGHSSVLHRMNIRIDIFTTKEHNQDISSREWHPARLVIGKSATRSWRVPEIVPISERVSIGSP